MRCEASLRQRGWQIHFRGGFHPLAADIKQRHRSKCGASGAKTLRVRFPAESQCRDDSGTGDDHSMRRVTRRRCRKEHESLEAAKFHCAFMQTSWLRAAVHRIAHSGFKSHDANGTSRKMDAKTEHCKSNRPPPRGSRTSLADASAPKLKRTRGLSEFRLFNTCLERWKTNSSLCRSCRRQR
jgi:hypothetical protein